MIDIKFVPIKELQRQLVTDYGFCPVCKSKNLDRHPLTGFQAYQCRKCFRVYLIEDS